MILQEQVGQVEKTWLHDNRCERATVEKTCRGVVGRESVGVSVELEVVGRAADFGCGNSSVIGEAAALVGALEVEVVETLKELSKCLAFILWDKNVFLQDRLHEAQARKVLS